MALNRKGCKNILRVGALMKKEENSAQCRVACFSENPDHDKNFHYLCVPAPSREDDNTLCSSTYRYFPVEKTLITHGSDFCVF